MRTVGAWSRAPVGSSSAEGRQGGVGEQPTVVGGVQGGEGDSGKVGDSGCWGGFSFFWENKSRLNPVFKNSCSMRVG